MAEIALQLLEGVDMPLNKQQLQEKGPKGHNLAHITPMEEVILKALGGSGRVNPQTNIKQYDGGHGGGHPHNGGGDDDDTDTYDSSQDDDASSGTGGTTDPGGVLDDDGNVTTTDDGGITVSTGSTGEAEWSYNPFSNEWDDLDVGRWWDEVAVPWFKETFGREMTPEEIKKMKEERKTGGDGSSIATQGVTIYRDSRGGEHDTQAGADTASLGFGKTDLLGEAAGFDYGGDDALGSTYSGAYEQQLSDAFEAANTGVGVEGLASGGDPQRDADGNAIDPYAELLAAQEGQAEWLETLSTNYQNNAQTQYDDWLESNTTAINALTTLEDINNYEWTEMPEFDTDWSGGINPDTGLWDSDWMPEFYSGFTKEYGPDYIGDDSWQYDEDGNPIPGSYVPATTSTGDGEEEGEAEIVEEPERLLGSTGNSQSTQAKGGAPGVAQFGKNSRNSAKYY